MDLIQKLCRHFLLCWPRSNEVLAATGRMPASLHSSEHKVKILNSIMTVVGWIVTIAALLAALGFGYMHLRYGPVDIRIPVRGR
jgi:hypothetical protein